MRSFAIGWSFGYGSFSSSYRPLTTQIDAIPFNRSGLYSQITEITSEVVCIALPLDASPYHRIKGLSFRLFDQPVFEFQWRRSAEKRDNHSDLALIGEKLVDGAFHVLERAFLDSHVVAGGEVHLHLGLLLGGLGGEDHLLD